MCDDTYTDVEFVMGTDMCNDMCAFTNVYTGAPARPLYVGELVLPCVLGLPQEPRVGACVCGCLFLEA